MRRVQRFSCAVCAVPFEPPSSLCLTCPNCGDDNKSWSIREGGPGKVFGWTLVWEGTFTCVTCKEEKDGSEVKMAHYGSEVEYTCSTCYEPRRTKND